VFVLFKFLLFQPKIPELFQLCFFQIPKINFIYQIKSKYEEINDSKSEGKFSAGKLLADEFVESFEGNGLGVETSNSVDDFPELFVGISVFELVVDISELINGEFSSSLQIIQAEVGSSSLFAEWVSLKFK
jgi:hypothetical protein